MLINTTDKKGRQMIPEARQLRFEDENEVPVMKRLKVSDAIK